MNETVIVFFSRDGSTRTAAGLIAERLGAGLIELKERKTRRGFLASGFRAASKKHITPDGDPWSEAAESSRVILGAPIWAGNGNPVLNGFLDRADFTGKKVFIFTLQADPGLKSSKPVLDFYSRRVEEAGGTVAGTFAVHGASPGKTASEKELSKALEGWELFRGQDT